MHLKQRNNRFALVLLCLAGSMVLLSFAAVPIYDLFCKATGFGGITKQGYNINKSGIGGREILIEFDANVSPELPWNFVPKQRKVKTRTGVNTLVFYESENLTDLDIVGTSVYNVTPTKAGQYFVKIHCFCFEEQLLKAHEKVLMPVSFFIDPAFDSDPEMQDVQSIILSYSFFRIR